MFATQERYSPTRAFLIATTSFGAAAIAFTFSESSPVIFLSFSRSNPETIIAPLCEPSAVSVSDVATLTWPPPSRIAFIALKLAFDERLTTNVPPFPSTPTVGAAY
jgi:hypothetical protein